MKTTTTASFSNVGQNEQAPRRKRALRSVRISARLGKKVAAAKPSNLSWGAFITRLLATHRKRDPYAVERMRSAAWASMSLDHLARDVPNRFPDDAGQTIDERLNRLEALGAFTHEIATKYEKFKNRFGHLYTNIAYSRYILRMEYRFTGTMMPDAPRYVNLNSGVMIHAQSPLSLSLKQGFPVSLEVQFLADEGKGPRPTSNLCTPGTNVEFKGQLYTRHILPSTAPTFPAEEWVRIEVEVHGHEEIIYRVNGAEVLRYQHPQLDPKDLLATKLLEAGAARLLSSGHIALQAEGQPVWFRNIELTSLETK